MSLSQYRMLMSPIKIEEVTEDILYFNLEVDNSDLVAYSASYGGKSISFCHGYDTRFHIDDVADVDTKTVYSAQSIVKILSARQNESPIRDENFNFSQFWHPSLIFCNTSPETKKDIGIALIILYGHMMSGELPEDEYVKKIIDSGTLKDVNIDYIKTLLEKIP